MESLNVIMKNLDKEIIWKICVSENKNSSLSEHFPYKKNTFVLLLYLLMYYLTIASIIFNSVLQGNDTVSFWKDNILGKMASKKLKLKLSKYIHGCT